MTIQPRDAAARQPRLPDRHVGLDERAEQAAAGQAVAGDAARRARRATTRSRSSPMPATPAPRSSRPRRARSAKILVGDRPARRRRQHRRRRGHPPGLCARRANLDPERRQPRDPGDRRRLQRRHHQPGRAQGLYRARARQGRVPVGARLRHGQLQRRADADAGPERQRRRRLHRHAVARRGRCWSRKRARPCSRSPRT